MNNPALATIFLAAALVSGGCVFSSGGGTANGPSTSPDNSAKAGDVTSTETAGSGGKVADIRKTDFKNFTYQPYCAGEETEKVAVKNGEFSREKDGDRFYFGVYGVTYGDVNGDGVDDALILTNCNTGGTGQFSEGFIYSLKEGKPELLARIEGGDRAYGGLRSAKVENGLVVVERNDVGEQGGACCPEFGVTTKYKLEGKELRKSGAETRRELYPAQRVKFEKGETGTTISVKLSADDDIKRFVVGAAKGQTLTVEADSPSVTLGLIGGDGEIVSEGERLVVDLKETGDFSFQLQKTSEKPVNVKLTVEIQ